MHYFRPFSISLYTWHLERVTHLKFNAQNLLLKRVHSRKQLRLQNQWANTNIFNRENDILSTKKRVVFDMVCFPFLYNFGFLLGRHSHSYFINNTHNWRFIFHCFCTVFAMGHIFFQGFSETAADDTYLDQHIRIFIDTAFLSP